MLWFEFMHVNWIMTETYLYCIVPKIQFHIIFHPEKIYKYWSVVIEKSPMAVVDDYVEASYSIPTVGFTYNSSVRSLPTQNA